MKKLVRKLFTPLVTIALAFGVGISLSQQKAEVGVKAAPTTVTVERSDFTGTGGYAVYPWTKDGISGEANIYATTTSSIQISTTTGRRPYPYNITMTPGPITSISATIASTTLPRPLTPRVSASAAVTTETSGTDLTSQSFTTAGQTLTWSISAGDNIRFFQLVPGGNLSLANFSFTYETSSQEFGTLESISLDTSNAKLNYFVGDVFTLDGLSVTAHDNLGATKIVPSGFTSDYDGHTFITSEIGTNIPVVISYTENSVTKTANYQISVEEAPILQKFTKITSVDQLHLGATYVIAGNKSDVVWVMSTIQATNNRTAIEATMDGLTIVETTDTQKFTLEKGTVANSFSFKAENGDTINQYIHAASSSNNYLRSSSTKDDNGSWRITFSGTELLAQSLGTYTRNQLKLNSTSALFAAYSSGQNTIDLYLDLTTIPTGDAQAEAYNVAYDINYGVGFEQFGTCEASLTAINTRYNSLSVNAKQLFDTSADTEYVEARARIAYLTAWVAANQAPAGRPTTTPISNNVAAIVLIGAIGLTTIVGYYFLNKKKLSA